MSVNIKQKIKIKRRNRYQILRGLDGTEVDIERLRSPDEMLREAFDKGELKDGDGRTIKTEKDFLKYGDGLFDVLGDIKNGTL